MLWVLGKQGVVHPAWEQDVPFTVFNCPDNDGLSSVRRFHFAHGYRDMVDRMTVINGQLFDDLGFRRRYRAPFTARVANGALTMRSGLMSVRVGRLYLPIPGPRVELTERWDSLVERQHVSVAITVPMLGLLYTYGGHFDFTFGGRVSDDS